MTGSREAGDNNLSGPMTGLVSCWPSSVLEGPESFLVSLLVLVLEARKW